MRPVAGPGSAPEALHRTVALVTLGCARNEVDSEELAGRLEAGGFQLVDDPSRRDDGRGQHLRLRRGRQEGLRRHPAGGRRPQDATGGVTKAVVAVGCLAERYGKELAESLPEADAVLGFDDYPDIAARLRSVLAGETPPPAHAAATAAGCCRSPRPPATRQPPASSYPGTLIAAPPDLPLGAAPASGPRPVRRRLDGGPMAPLKLASGCDRRCTFCAIPSFRGSFVSRRPADVLAEARWLAGRASRSCSWSARTRRPTARTSATCGCSRRCSPTSRPSTGSSGCGSPTSSPPRPVPGWSTAIAGTDRVAAYFDLSFQHAAPTVLRRMRRFGDPDSFLGLLDQVRAQAPAAGVRSNVIVGFPGETEEDLADALRLPRRGPARRRRRLRLLRRGRHRGRDARREARRGRGPRAGRRTSPRLVEELTAQRAEDRVGEEVAVLVERVARHRGVVEGRAAHQGPEVDGTTTVRLAAGQRAVVGDAGGRPRRGLRRASTSSPSRLEEPS